MNEKAELLSVLQASEARLIAAVSHLSEEAWSFREAADRWTVLENVEHLALAENFLRGAIARTLQQPPVDVDTSDKEVLVVRLAETRADRIISRDVNVPTGRFATIDEALAAFHAERATTIALLGTSDANFRRHVFPHTKFGEIDCCQWMILLSTHVDRHLRQIDEVLTAWRRQHPRG